MILKQFKFEGKMRKMPSPPPPPPIPFYHNFERKFEKPKDNRIYFGILWKNSKICDLDAELET